MTDALTKLALVLLVDRSGGVLLQLRGPDARNHPDVWGLPGGHIEPGEAPFAAAVRELSEESGLAADGGLRLFWHGVVPESGVERFVYCGPTSASQDDVVLGEGAAMEFTPRESIWDGRPFVQADADVLGRFLPSSDYAELCAARSRKPETAEVAVLEVPQWQGSRAPDARRLADGAGLLSALIRGAGRAAVVALDDPGTRVGGVHGLEVLDTMRKRIAFAHDQLDGRFVITVGGECSVDLSPVSAASERWGEELAVVWFDAHGDLNTPASSPSGAFHGMVLRTLLGEGPERLVPGRPLRPEQVVLAGTRALDPGEEEFVGRTGMRRVSVAELATADRLLEVLEAQPRPRVYVHVDLDVLDPGLFGSVGYPEPGGLSVAELAAAVRALARECRVVGLGIAEFMPRSPAGDVEQGLRALVDEVADVFGA